jgi:cytochrome P450
MLLLLVVPVGCYVFYTILIAIYYLYWDALAHIPGRKTWIVFPISKQIASLRGTLDSETRQMHLDHGPIIRLGPRELSFITAQAWTDIYGFGHPQLPKTQRRPKNEVHSIISADDADHARFRKAMSHAFSEKALRDQEILMKRYIDLLIEKLSDIAVSGLKTDMVKWYNYTTFDLIGDLAFGQSFGCLLNSQTHFWVEYILKFVRAGALLRIGYDYPNLMRIFQLFISSNSSEIRKSQFAWTRKTVLNRINNKDLQGRKDFLESMLRYKGHEFELSEPELISNSNILVLAGSETTATLLCGVTYYLLKNSGSLKRATDEVRTQFEHEEEITFTTATAKLPYMLACLNEALRRYPPFPGTMTRKTLAGDPTKVSGIHVPADVSLTLFQ